MQHKAYIKDLEIILNFDRRHEARVKELYDFIESRVERIFGESLTVSYSEIEEGGKKDSKSDDNFTLDLDNLGKSWGYKLMKKDSNGKPEDVTDEFKPLLESGHLSIDDVGKVGVWLSAYRIDGDKETTIKDRDLVIKAREIVKKKFSKS
jgi:hypothetical protein